MALEIIKDILQVLKKIQEEKPLIILRKTCALLCKNVKYI